MQTKLIIGGENSAGPKVKQRTRWSLTSKLFASRRPLSQVICRKTPIIVGLWAFVVILLLWRQLVTNEDNSANQFDTSQQQTFQKNFNQPLPVEIADSAPTTIEAAPQVLPPRQTSRPIVASSQPNIAFNETISSVLSSGPVSSTRRQESDDYVRDADVFILVVQDERPRPMPSGRRTARTTSTSDTSYYASTGIHLGITDIPGHIRLVMEVLDAHRIGYTLGSTLSGLPSALLTDQASRYSVVIIDDFVRYTKLSLWLRDQLDRHCRKNHIGVVGFVSMPAGSRSSELRGPKQKSATTTTTTTTTTFGGHNSEASARFAETSSQLLPNKFPVTFRPIDRCNATKTCRMQLNERSPILRLLKRKPNFVVTLETASNSNNNNNRELSDGWVAFESSHITYEPLTWVSRSGSPVAGTRYARDDGTSSASSSRLSSGDPFRLGLAESETEFESEFEPNVKQQQRNNNIDNDDDGDGDGPTATAVYDRGLYDGIERVLFGNKAAVGLSWLYRLLLLDSIEHLSRGRVFSPLERYIQIDVDDIFVGQPGSQRLVPADVDALLDFQVRLSRRLVGGFQFNLGFSGKHYKKSNRSDELAGDERLVELGATNFTWFCHTWSHSKAHLATSSKQLEQELRNNLDFARNHGLKLIGHARPLDKAAGPSDKQLPPTYAIAPHHSGVYPVHEQLYSAWRNVLNVQVTSTEEYPHLRPAWSRRAFVQQAIKVLPRQTCGLYTHTVFASRYPGGLGQLRASINGGQLFQTLLHNAANIYMTHMSNYAHDRLALHTFGALVDFVQSNTNLVLKFAPSRGPRDAASGEGSSDDHDDDDDEALGPRRLASLYFGLHPDEREPVWTNPCSDPRHLEIWAPARGRLLCPLAPKLLVVGPQKTGTAALHRFLQLNKLFKTSRQSPADFEEVQFFNDKHYFKGPAWYFSRFQADDDRDRDNNNNNNSSREFQSPGGGPSDGERAPALYFDKSATYFDDPKAARRASRLLPDAFVVILLIDPAERAYSWYQHARAHLDPAASELTFEQVIQARDAEPRARALRKRCLEPGYYSQHLAKWLEFYPSRQIIIIDGQWLRANPASVLNRLQLVLRLEQSQTIDYAKVLAYDQRKGFFCELISGSEPSGTQPGDSPKTRCLGEAKGRKYPPMSRDARLYLARHYWARNRQLARILTDIGQSLPSWLLDATSLSQLI